jgi:hypothetical protein
MADEEILDAIRNPDSENVPILLDRLGFGGAPSPEQVYREIEEKLLLPKDRMPDHWLLSYQMYVNVCLTTIDLSWLATQTMAAQTFHSVLALSPTHTSPDHPLIHTCWSRREGHRIH